MSLAEVAVAALVVTAVVTAALVAGEGSGGVCSGRGRGGIKNSQQRQQQQKDTKTPSAESTANFHTCTERRHRSPTPRFWAVQTETILQSVTYTG